MTRAGSSAVDAPILNRFWMRLGLFGALVLTVLLIWASHIYLTWTFSEEAANRAKIRATLYAGSIQSTLQRHAVVPLLLSRDPFLTLALRGEQYQGADERLAGLQEELGSGPIFLLDANGALVAASDDRPRGAFEGDRQYYIAALAGDGTEFAITPGEDGESGFYYSRRLVAEDQFLGVVVVTVDLGLHERGWRTANARVAVTDSEGGILLASDPLWRGSNLAAVMSREGPSSPVRNAIRTAETRVGHTPYAYFDGTPYLLAEVPLGFRSWWLVFFDTLADVRARVNAILSLIVTGLALLLALAFYMLSRRRWAETRRVRRESDELRALNHRLSHEIAARQKVERNLKEAEQSLEQASKLAALGQMSAAVSHELNQPLAAMKTYLAGARLLLKRRRSEEALTSFQRIDDLINRMSGITRQLKSYARKGEAELEPIDLRENVREALAMMAPQLGKMAVAISTTLPSEPVMLQADPLRIEQIIVNLLRNALDAVRHKNEPRIRILLVQGETVMLSIEDNGPGLADPDKLFEPFYTTKKPGEGLGLGLAISAGFAGELGGRLVARNGGADGGAVFDLILPRQPARPQAAE
jgi:two-component system, NtrC family, C4-dicarboxylate transport sensor histidine kinase DctB